MKLLFVLFLLINMAFYPFGDFIFGDNFSGIFEESPLNISSPPSTPQITSFFEPVSHFNATFQSPSPPIPQHTPPSSETTGSSNSKKRRKRSQVAKEDLEKLATIFNVPNSPSSQIVKRVLEKITSTNGTNTGFQFSPPSTNLLQPSFSPSPPVLPLKQRKARKRKDFDSLCERQKKSIRINVEEAIKNSTGSPEILEPISTCKILMHILKKNDEVCEEFSSILNQDPLKVKSKQLSAETALEMKFKAKLSVDNYQEVKKALEKVNHTILFFFFSDKNFFDKKASHQRDVH